MTIDAWPSDLPTGVVCFYPIGGGRSGGGGFMSPPAYGASTYGPRWTAKLDRLPLLRRETLLAARALQTRLENGAKPIMLEACPGLLSPQVQGGAAMESVLGADAGAGADELQILLAGDFHAMRGGEQFSADHDNADVGRRMYRVVELVDNTDPAAVTVRIVPRLRADLAAEAVLDFLTPSCPMRLVEGFDLPTEAGRFSAAEAMFEEWFAESPVAQTAALRPLTLSPATIDEGSAEDTFVGRLFGMTSGSTVTLTDDAGGRFKLVDDAGALKIFAGATATDYDLATSHPITVTETLLGRSNSPRDTVLTIEVNDTGHTHNAWRILIDNSQAGILTALAEVTFKDQDGNPVSGGVAIASGDELGGVRTSAFDGSAGTQWVHGVGADAWIGKDWTGTPKAIASADLYVGNDFSAIAGSPMVAHLQWSDDLVTWTTQTSQTYGDTWVNNQTRPLPEAAPAAGLYRVLRLWFTDLNGGSYLQVNEIEFRATVSGVDLMDTVANRFNANVDEFGGQAYRAANNVAGDSWVANTPANNWWEAIFITPVECLEVAVTVTSDASNAPKNVILKGTVDRTAYVDVRSSNIGGWAPPQTKVF